MFSLKCFAFQNNIAEICWILFWHRLHQNKKALQIVRKLALERKDGNCFEKRKAIPKQRKILKGNGKS